MTDERICTCGHYGTVGTMVDEDAVAIATKSWGWDKDHIAP